jgi:hypothetical protein
MVRLLFFALLCSLIVPRAAWGAHLAGHEELSVAGAAHTHHGDHVHEHGVENSADHEAVWDESDALTHEHSPALSLCSAVVLPDSVILPVWPLSAEAQIDRKSVGEFLRHPDSLLRPPRTV